MKKPVSLVARFDTGEEEVLFTGKEAQDIYARVQLANTMRGVLKQLGLPTTQEEAEQASPETLEQALAAMGVRIQRVNPQEIIDNMTEAEMVEMVNSAPPELVEYARNNTCGNPDCAVHGVNGALAKAGKPPRGVARCMHVRNGIQCVRPVHDYDENGCIFERGC